MKKCVVALGIAAMFFLGCSSSTEKCLEKQGFKSCEDFTAAAKKAQGNDEVYRFHTIAKKCGCPEE